MSKFVFKLLKVFKVLQSILLKTLLMPRELDPRFASGRIETNPFATGMLMLADVLAILWGKFDVKI